MSPFIVLPFFFAAILVFFMLNYDPYAVKPETKELIPQLVVGVAAAVSTVYLFLEYKLERLDTKRIIAVMFILGFALRLMYCLKYSYSQNQHDVESLVSSGHLSYLYNLATGKGLPQSNDWQFSHPPLHHFLSSLVVRASLALGFRNATAFENVQLLTCFYSTLTMFVGYAILKECKVEGRALVIGSLLLSFHPTFFILAGSINNDILTILLSAFALLYLIKWNNKPSWLNALLCGSFVGLGMMTKFSAALVAVVAAVSVIVKFATDKTLKFPEFLAHTCIFLAVMLPLGLWYQVRNGILFQQPLGYVAPISTESKLYIGNMSITERMLTPFSSNKLGVYVDVWNEHNLWQYLIRNSLFGEYSFGNEGIAYIAVYANLLVTALTVVAVVLLIIKRKMFVGAMLPVTVMLVCFWAFFIYFNISSPFRCSMDFRYVVPVLFCTSAILGAINTEYKNAGGIVSKIFTALCESSVVLLAVSSVLVFI